ncbi:hypothetical protein GCK32_014236, partial [Trichostrongylus colubriformis]
RFICTLRNLPSWFLLKNLHCTSRMKPARDEISTIINEEEDSEQSEELDVHVTGEHHEYETKAAVNKLSRVGLRRSFHWRKLGYYCVVISYLATFDSLTIFTLNVKTYGVYWLILYIICMGLIGFPLLYLEAALGQYVNASALTIFDRIAPICVGIGVSSTITLFLCCLIDHHRLIMVFVASFDSFNFFADKLPWAECLSRGVEGNTPKNRVAARGERYQFPACSSLMRKCSTVVQRIGVTKSSEIISYAGDFKPMRDVYRSIGDTCFRSKMRALHIRYDEKSKSNWLLSLPVIDYFVSGLNLDYTTTTYPTNGDIFCRMLAFAAAVLILGYQREWVISVSASGTMWIEL